MRHSIILAQPDVAAGMLAACARNVSSEAKCAFCDGPNWKDSILFLTYDEHGGFYDHVAPAPAPQGGAPNPDGISSAQSLPRPPANSPVAESTAQSASPRKRSSARALPLTGPLNRANVEQLGLRVPFIPVSPFSKPHYVSHTVGDHTSMLALIEKRCLGDQDPIPHLTARDANADTLEDMFDFNPHAPSKHAVIDPRLAPAPATPCAG